MMVALMIGDGCQQQNQAGKSPFALELVSLVNCNMCVCVGVCSTIVREIMFAYVSLLTLSAFRYINKQSHKQTLLVSLETRTSRT